MSSLNFPYPSYYQINDECIPASLGTALYPFTGVPVDQIISESAAHLRFASGESGYDRIADIFREAPGPGFQIARGAVALERTSDMPSVARALKGERATAIVAISWPDGHRAPHSVCISAANGRFCLRDSANFSDGHPVFGHAHSDSLESVLRTLGSDIIIGEAIVIRPI